MLNAENLKLLGVFLKTHGVDGHLVLKLSYTTEEDLIEEEPVFVEIDGIPVPFFVSDFRYISNDTAILALDDINNSTEAVELVNSRVLIEKDKMAGLQEKSHERSEELKGFRIVDETRGDSGILREIIEYPENPVMLIELGTQEVLIPFHESIVKKIDHKNRVLEISAPEGLFDLYLED